MNRTILGISALALTTMGGCMLHGSETGTAYSVDGYWESTYTRHVSYYTELWCANTCAQCQPCVDNSVVRK